MAFHRKDIRMSFTRCLYHVIFRTKLNQLTLPIAWRRIV